MLKQRAMILLAALCCLLLAGCGRESAETDAFLAVYSLSGESDEVTLSNGVLVLTDAEQTLDGGDLYYHPAEPFDTVRYTTEIYLSAGGERNVLISMGAQDTTGGGLEVSGDVGGCSGQMLTEEQVYGLKEASCFFELTCTDRSGEERIYTLPLTLTEVVAPEETAAEEISQS